MNSLVKIISTAVLVAILNSGCDQQNLSKPKAPIVDKSLEAVDNKSVVYIADINQIALEWKKVSDKRVDGYYIYRTGENSTDKLKRIAEVSNRLSTHYTDIGLEPNTTYLYKISSKLPSGQESVSTSNIQVKTKPTLKAVSFVQAISNLARAVKISWRPHKNQRTQYYVIERSIPADPQWNEIAKLEGRLVVEYIDEGLKDNAIYKYRVKVVTFDGIESVPSKIVEAQTKPLPEFVSKLSATKDLPRKIKLTWEKSKTKDTKQYQILRSDSLNGSYKEIKKVPAASLSFEDVIEEDNKAYFYKVATIDSDGLVSKLNITPVMGKTLKKPEAPIISGSSIKDDKIEIRWEKPSDDRAVSYIVHKTVNPSAFNPKKIRIRDVKDTFFLDKDVLRGTEYQYSIEAVDKFGLISEQTEATKLSLPKIKVKQQEEE
jgi:fibronectin type 3 domain-containing protein